MTKQYDFELFKHTPARQEVTLQKRGLLGLNKLAFESLGCPSHVELLWDRNTHVIGLRAADSTLPHAYPVRKQARAESYIVGLQAFLRYYGIHPQETYRIPTYVDEGVLIVPVP